MIRTVKMSLILGLGLSLSNPLSAAMNQAPAQDQGSEDINIVLENLDALIAIVEIMNNAAVNAAQNKAAEFDADSTNDTEITQVRSAAGKASHEYFNKYQCLKDKLPLDLKEMIYNTLKDIRKKYLGDDVHFETTNDVIKALENGRHEKIAFFVKLKETLTPQRTPSKFELAWERDLDQQT